MKKLVFLCVALLVAPVMADVTFDGTYDGVDTVTISYTSTDAPRGVALKLTCTGTVQVEGYVALSADAAYNCFIDYAYSTDPYDIGDGHPLADPAGPGVATLPAPEVSVCMGVLDQDGNQAAGPADAPQLLQITVSGTGTIEMTADTLRGPGSGVVGSEIPSNLSNAGMVEIIIDGEPPCLTVGEYAGVGDLLVTQDIYDRWVSLGSPDVWCKNCFPRGDANSDCAITFSDVSAVIAAWPPNPYAANADFNMDGGITFSDVSVLIGHWPPNPGCDASCVPGE